MPSILLIRHAQASFGSPEYDVLSKRGEAQVNALVGTLTARRLRVASVVCGDLRRQCDTAAPCAQAHGAELLVDPRLNEYRDRDILGHHASVAAGLEQQAGDAPLSSRQFQEVLNGALRAWIAAGANSPCEEPWPDFRGRVTAAVRDVADSLERGQTALVVSSGGAIAAVCVELMGLPAQAAVTFNEVSVNTSITKLVVGRAGTTVVSINEHGHLERSDAGSLVTYR